MIGTLTAPALTLAAAISAQADVPPEIRRLMVDLPVEAEPAPLAAGDPFIDVGRGPIPVHVPPTYDPDVPVPLVILLHGYTSSGADVEAWMRLAPLADEFGFLYLAPDGSRDCFGNRYWNATDACCWFCGPKMDDSAYLLAVIDEMKLQYAVDPDRVHFVGHSNGGFMSYRMACDHSASIAAIASFAGATWLDPQRCAPDVAVHQLQIHGTNDAVIGYDGGCILGNCYPGALESTEMWASFDGCESVGENLPDLLDLDADVPGAETTVRQYVTDCDPGGSAQLWTIAGGTHSPRLAPGFGRHVVEYLLSHPKRSPCPGDANGDGEVGFDDVLAVLAAWGAYEGCPPYRPEDIDESCDVGFADLLAVLSAWGPCP